MLITKEVVCEIILKCENCISLLLNDHVKIDECRTQNQWLLVHWVRARWCLQVSKHEYKSNSAQRSAYD